MFDVFTQMFSYTFLQRAIIVGLLVSLCSALLGVSMVLRRSSMIGDGLSHVGFAAFAIAAVLNLSPLYFAVPVCIIAAFLLLRINKSSRINADAAIAIVCSGALAIGVMVISFSSGMNTDINSYMFGSILSLTEEDAFLGSILSVLVIILFFIFYNRIFSVTFDETFARATGTRAGLYNTVLAILTAVTVVIGMRMMGSLLISSLIIFPPLSAMRICRSYKRVMLVSVADSVLCFMIGIFISYVYSTPTGASVVCVHLVVFTLLSMVSFIRKRIGR